jgi:hypothetical protein
MTLDTKAARIADAYRLTLELTPHLAADLLTEFVKSAVIQERDEIAYMLSTLAESKRTGYGGYEAQSALREAIDAIHARHEPPVPLPEGPAYSEEAQG